MRSLKLLIFVLILIAIGYGIFWYTNPGKPQRPPKSFTVTSAPIVKETTPVYFNTLGTIQPLHTVNVMPQITGTVKTISFSEGQSVKAGDVLISIDPLPFQLNLANAEAVMQKDQATVTIMQATVNRDQSLLEIQAIAPQAYEQDVANLKSAQAAVLADQAQVSIAQNQLSYTNITAPIDGKTGNLNVKVGDLVTANTTALLTINQLNPVLAVFSIPQTELSAVLQAAKLAPLKVVVSADDQQKFYGTMNFVDNAVNPQTGTVVLKAQINNPDELLWPGEVVTVDIILKEEPNSIVIPSTTLQMDDHGMFVFILKNGTAAIQRVTVSRRIGKDAVISKGLTGTETLLAETPPNLEDGTPVVLAALS